MHECTINIAIAILYMYRYVSRVAVYKHEVIIKNSTQMTMHMHAHNCDQCKMQLHVTCVRMNGYLATYVHR